MHRKLFTGAKGIFNAFKYEISKEPGIKPNLEHLNSILSNGEDSVDKATLDKIIELSEK